MTSPPTTIVGWSTSYKVPGVAEETIFAAGAITAGSIPNKVVVTGTKITAGSATPDQDVVQIFSADDADLKLGAGSEAAIQCYAALAQDPNILLYAAPPAEAGGATAATANITFDGVPTSTGTWGAWIDGEYFSRGIAITDAPLDIANGCRDEYNSNPRRPMTATVAAGAGTSYIVTFTTKSKGARANDHSIFIDKSALATGVTMVLGGGGSALTGGGKRFGSGSGADNVTTILTALYPDEYAYIAAAQNDATNAGRWKNQVNAKAAPTENRIDRVVMGHNGLQSAAISLAQTTCNDYRMQVLHSLNNEWHPSQLAAAMAAARSSREQDDPSVILDDLVLVGAPPQRAPADRPQNSVMNTSLLNSVTPLKTEGGALKVVMSITTYSLLGSTPDYRCLQTYYEVVPDRLRKDLGIRWLSDVKKANPHVADDEAEGQKERPAGIWTPKRANAWIMGVLHEYEDNGWLIDVDLNPPSTGYDKNAKRLVSVIPAKVAPGNHQYGLSVRQLAA